MIDVTNENFESEVLKSDKPVIVDFWAPWCGPCRALAPVLSALARENHLIKIVKVNVDDNQDVAQQYKVSSIPTLVMFKEGQESDRRIGVMNKTQLDAWIKE